MLVFGRKVEDPPPQSLESRIASFLRNGPQVEDLDGTDFIDLRKSGKTADFLLWDRRLVVEMKAPKADPRGRLGAIVSEAMAEEPRVFAYGRVGIQAILRKRKNGEEVNRRMLTNGTRHVRQLLQKANRQIKETQEKLSLSAAGGVVVMPIEADQPLEVGVVAHAIRHALDAEVDHLSHVDYVWASFEAHTVKPKDGSAVFPELIVWREDARPIEEMQLVATMIDAWADHNQTNLVHVDHTAGWETLAPHGQGWPLDISILPSTR